ncbi:MAG: hypothetical protein HC915_18155, partial [Anaerolineae bacterium]|nr:hypothetical protein [Anaerolineae bacterium]
MLCLGSAAAQSPTPGPPLTGIALFAAFTDTTQDGLITPEADASSLYALDLADGTLARLGSRPRLPLLP